MNSPDPPVGIPNATSRRHRTELERLPEIELLARIARATNVTFHLVGSTARRLADPNFATHPQMGGSLFEAVDPLSEIDVHVPSPDAAQRLAARIAAALPRARFYKWEFRTPEDQRRYLSRARVMVTGTPVVTFGVGGDASAAQNGVHVVLTEAEGQSAVSCDVTPPLKLKPTVNVRASGPEGNGARGAFEACLELLYVARAHPSALAEAAVLRQGLEGRVADQLPDYLRAYTRQRERLQFSLSKLLLARKRSPDVKEPAEILGAAATAALARVDDRILKKLFSLHAAQAGTAARNDVMVVAVPHRRRRIIQQVRAIRKREHEVAALWVKSAGTGATPRAPIRLS